LKEKIKQELKFELGYNYTLTAGVVAWCSAQIIKTLINFIKCRQFNAERLIGAGGMPSSHTAMVVAAVISVGRTKGTDSTDFALAFLFSAIVIYDAMGVRRAAGIHAKEINNMKRTIPELFSNPVNGKKAKELQEYLGHTPIEVCGGFILGIIIAFILPMKV
jgi:hypothetical protein